MHPTLTMRAIFAASTAVFLLSAGTASASTVTLEGTISFATAGFSGNVPSIVDVLNISSGLPDSVDTLFQADPARSAGTWSDLVKGTIEAVFSFEEVDSLGNVVATGSLTQDATYQANYKGKLSCSTSTGQSDCIYWAGNGHKPTDDGSTYTTHGDKDNVSTTPSVTDLVTMSDGDFFDVNFFDAQDWNITPAVSFTNETFLEPPENGSTTPLPGALPFFAGGLALLGFIGGPLRRRKSAPAR
jgi:hypothetical protein